MNINWKKVGLGVGSAGAILGLMTATFEGTRYVPYQDVTGVWTNCQGNTHGVDPNVTMSPSMCAGVDAANQQGAFEDLHSVVDVPLNRNESAAFADFIYNEGIGTFKKSSILTAINAGEVKLGCQNLLKYVYAGGKKLPGLVTRRQAEYVVCITEPPV